MVNGVFLHILLYEAHRFLNLLSSFLSLRVHGLGVQVVKEITLSE